MNWALAAAGRSGHLPGSLPAGWTDGAAAGRGSGEGVYQAHTPCLSMAHLPALVRAHAARRGVTLPAAGGATHCSPQSLLALLAELARRDGPDAAFVLGQQWLPGHDGALSHAILQAEHAGQALALLVEGQARLTPLLSPRLVLGPQQAVLYWTDACGAPAQRNFLVDLHMAAVVSLCQWLGGGPLPWTFCFNRAAPREAALHEVHLGPALRWGCQLDAMLIDRDCLARPWSRGAGPAAAAARAAWWASAGATGPRQSLLTRLYDWLRDRMAQGPTLEAAAQAFGVSPATLKRQLARHGTHFQAELDQVRAHVALHLFHHEGWGNEAVAGFLGFHDVANFRRSFRRWTGVTPRLLRDHLLALAGLGRG